jgi:MarR family transcriptional regulator, 2-MHQ and catechol-resistance regulon repressor
VSKQLQQDTERALAAYASLVRAHDSLGLELGRQLQAYGLTVGQFRMLAELWHTGPATLATLSEKLLFSHTNGRVINRSLDQFGLVVRQAHETDKRKIMLHLTPRGEKLIAEVFPWHARLVRARMRALDRREQNALQRMCEKLEHGNLLKFFLDLGSGDWNEAEEEAYEVEN